MADRQRQTDDINKDLGLGSKVAQQSRLRFLNRDGSFNVRRKGFPFLRSLNVYHWMLTMSWTSFNSIVIASYFVVNLLFASGYTLCGPLALKGSVAQGTGDRFLE